MTGTAAARAGALATAVLAAACGPSSSSAHSDGASVEITVLAAASLTEAFTELGARFEATAPGVEVQFDFESSASLVRKLDDGAAADVYASADETTMARAASAGNVVDTRLMARNRMRLLVAPGNPRRIRGLADLDRPGLVFVACAPPAPCGRLGALALERAGVAAEPASLEENVKAVVSRVTLGEADAGIVYATDVGAAGSAEGVELGIADDPALEAAYPVAVVKHSAHPREARRFVDYVLSPAGQSVLARFGFRRP